MTRKKADSLKQPPGDGENTPNASAHDGHTYTEDTLPPLSSIPRKDRPHVEVLPHLGLFAATLEFTARGHRHTVWGWLRLTPHTDEDRAESNTDSTPEYEITMSKHTGEGAVEWVHPGEFLENLGSEGAWKPKTKVQGFGVDGEGGLITTHVLASGVELPQPLFDVIKAFNIQLKRRARKPAPAKHTEPTSTTQPPTAPACHSAPVPTFRLGHLVIAPTGFPGFTAQQTQGGSTQAQAGTAVEVHPQQRRGRRWSKLTGVEPTPVQLPTRRKRKNLDKSKDGADETQARKRLKSEENNENEATNTHPNITSRTDDENEWNMSEENYENEVTMTEEKHGNQGNMIEEKHENEVANTHPKPTSKTENENAGNRNGHKFEENHENEATKPPPHPASGRENENQGNRNEWKSEGEHEIQATNWPPNTIIRTDNEKEGNINGLTEAKTDLNEDRMQQVDAEGAVGAEGVEVGEWEDNNEGDESEVDTLEGHGLNIQRRKREVKEGEGVQMDTGGNVNYENKEGFGYEMYEGQQEVMVGGMLHDREAWEGWQRERMEGGEFGEPAHTDGTGEVSYWRAQKMQLNRIMDFADYTDREWKKTKEELALRKAGHQEMREQLIFQEMREQLILVAQEKEGVEGELKERDGQNALLRGENEGLRAGKQAWEQRQRELIELQERGVREREQLKAELEQLKTEKEELEVKNRNLAEKNAKLEQRVEKMGEWYRLGSIMESLADDG